MKVLNISKNGTIKCEMSDGRLGYTYKSGYVRVSCKQTNYTRNVKLYQINTKVKLFNSNRDNYYYRRVLLPNELDRLRLLYNFDLKNCQNK